ncbi:hypothetical protein JCM11251_000769 [Rhodosporidiobolus azoricus]
MLRSVTRPLARSLAAPLSPAAVRHASSGGRRSTYASQKTHPVVYASVGLAALLGWSAAILTVGGAGKDKKQAGHGKKDSRSAPASSATPSPAPTLEPAPTPSADIDAADATSASSQSAAYNPETGEINWDCPCLGGMADGPCGEEFKTAFSCFIYSEAEPKGIDCVEKFRGMQECFRKYPEVYGSEAEDLEAEEEDEGFDLISRAEAALALPDEHFMEEVAKEAPTQQKKQGEAAASLE